MEIKQFHWIFGGNCQLSFNKLIYRYLEIYLKIFTLFYNDIQLLWVLDHIFSILFVFMMLCLVIPLFKYNLYHLYTSSVMKIFIEKCAKLSGWVKNWPMDDWAHFFPKTCFWEKVCWIIRDPKKPCFSKKKRPQPTSWTVKVISDCLIQAFWGIITFV